MKNYPKTIEDFVKSPWSKKLKTLISNFKLNEPAEDVYNDIICELIEKDYLKRWNPKYGSYSNWIYTFASNICKKKYNRSNSKGGKAIEGARSITYSSGSEEEFTSGVLFEELLVLDTTAPSADADVAFNQMCALIERELSKFPANSTNEYEGKVYERDMKTVFNMLREGYSPKEIAERFATSVEFIYVLIRRMRPIVASIVGHF